MLSSRDSVECTVFEVTAPEEDVGETFLFTGDSVSFNSAQSQCLLPSICQPNCPDSQHTVLDTGEGGPGGICAEQEEKKCQGGEVYQIRLFESEYKCELKGMDWKRSMSNEMIPL